MGLAGTDFAQFRHFSVAAEQYRRGLISTVNADITANAVGKERYEADETLWSKVPPFQYEAPGVVTVVAQQSLSLMLLAGWALAACLAAAWTAAHRLKAD